VLDSPDFFGAGGDDVSVVDGDDGEDEEESDFDELVESLSEAPESAGFGRESFT